MKQPMIQTKHSNGVAEIYFKKVKDSDNLVNLYLVRPTLVQAICLNKEELKRLKKAINDWGEMNDI